MPNIKELIEEMVKPLIKLQTLRGEVISVDKETDVCEIKPLNGGANYYDVRLKSVIKKTDTRSIIYPKAGSIVHFAIIEDNPADTYVTQISEFDSMIMEAKDLSIEVSDTGELKIQAKKIELNGGALGGLIKIQELTTQISKNTALLNAIQQMFTGWTPAAGDGGAVLKGLSSTVVGMPKADLSNIENKEITHG